jgi:hypothetical protein
MSEVQILLPLSIFDGAKDLKPETLVTTLQDAVFLRNNLLRFETRVAELQQQIHSYGASLELILEEVDNPLEKAKALRKLAADMKGVK